MNLLYRLKYLESYDLNDYKYQNSINNSVLSGVNESKYLLYYTSERHTVCGIQYVTKLLEGADYHALDMHRKCTFTPGSNSKKPLGPKVHFGCISNK